MCMSKTDAKERKRDGEGGRRGENQTSINLEGRIHVSFFFVFSRPASLCLTH